MNMLSSASRRLFSLLQASKSCRLTFYTPHRRILSEHLRQIQAPSIVVNVERACFIAGVRLAFKNEIASTIFARGVEGHEQAAAHVVMVVCCAHHGGRVLDRLVV